MSDTPTPEQLYDDDESFVEGEDEWANFDPDKVLELERRFEQLHLLKDSAERLAAAKDLMAEMNA